MITGGGGVTSTDTCTGCAIFGGTYFHVENKFWGIDFDKIKHDHLLEFLNLN